MTNLYDYEIIPLNSKTDHFAICNINSVQYDRVNRLLEIPSLSELTDRELYQAGANTNQCELIFEIVFDDTSVLKYYLCSGSENYYDDIVWNSPDGMNVITFECNFELCDIEFTIGEDHYKVVIQKEA